MTFDLGLNQSDYFHSLWCDRQIKSSLFVFPNLRETGSVSTSASSFQCDCEHFHIQASFYKMKIMLTVSVYPWMKNTVGDLGYILSSKGEWDLCD